MIDIWNMCFLDDYTTVCTYATLLAPLLFLFTIALLIGLVYLARLGGSFVVDAVKAPFRNRGGTHSVRQSAAPRAASNIDTAPLLLLQPASQTTLDAGPSMESRPDSPQPQATTNPPSPTAAGTQAAAPAEEAAAPATPTTSGGATTTSVEPLPMTPTPSAYGPPAALGWKGIGYNVSRKQLVAPNSAQLGLGLHCLLGPSGAGKSTLLGVLCGRKRKGETVGSVLLHGCQAPASVRRARVGYVTQDDVLPSTSTVAEHLSFHARLRASWLNAKARGQLVESALMSVGLSHKANNIIGDGYVRGLSGGERRRVSVAVELLVAAARAARAAGSTSGCAPILIMDEPFSGLDSNNARLLLSALVSVAKGGAAGYGGACVLLSVHQPTSRFMRAMSGCLVMAPGGHLPFLRGRHAQGEQMRDLVLL